MKTLGQTTFQHFSLAEIVYNHHAKNKGKIGGKMRDLCFRKMPSLLGKKKSPCLSSIRYTCWLLPDNQVDSNHMQGYSLHFTSPLCLLAWYTINFLFQEYYL